MYEEGGEPEIRRLNKRSEDWLVSTVNVDGLSDVNRKECNEETGMVQILIHMTNLGTSHPP